MKNFLVYLLVFQAFLGTTSKAQMNNFVFPTQQFDVSSSPVTISSIGGTSTGFWLSSGIYDVSGSLRFYIRDNSVFDPSHSAVGSLPTYGSYDSYQAELVIVPIPGECDKYYVFYGLASGPMGGQAVVYVVVDCSGSTVSVSTDTGGNPFLVHSEFSGVGPGLAASKKIGTGASAYYYLYWTKGNSFTGVRIMVSKITSSGLGTNQDIGYGSTSSSASPKELELSENGEWLAWNGQFGNTNIHAIKLSNPTTYASGTEQVYNYLSCNGIELVGSGTPDLYIAGPGTFDAINLLTQSATSLYADLSPYNLDYSFIEYSKSGQVCGFCEYGGNTYFIEYDVAQQSVNATQVSVYPNESNSTITDNYTGELAGLFYMPDQIDGEDYDNFNTMPEINFSNLLINGQQVSTECGTWTQVYNCNEILLMSDVTGACESEICITRYDEDCNLLYGSGYFNYTGAVAVSANGTIVDHDLREYAYEELSLANSPGYYGLTLTAWDCCGRQSQKTVFLEVLQAINPSINLGVYDYNNPQIYLSPSHNIITPNLVGASSIGFAVYGSTGFVNELNVVVDEVSISGSFIGNILNETKYYSLTGITYEGLNTYCVPTTVWGTTPPTTACSVNSPSSYNGYKSYFSYNNTSVAGKYYKLAVTLSNPCSSSSQWTYLYINDAWSRTSHLTTIKDVQLNNYKVSVFPNPASSEIKFQISAKNDESVIVELYDSNGRLVEGTRAQHFVTGGEIAFSIPILNFPQGMYIWKVSSENEQYRGKVLIAK